MPGEYVQPAQIPNGSSVMDLASYVAVRGNPLVNGHSLLPGRCGNKVDVFVVVNTPLADRGMHSLANVVQDKSGARFAGNSVLQALSQCAVDDLSVIHLVGPLITEFCSRDEIKLRLEASGPLATSPAGKAAQGSVQSGRGPVPRCSPVAKGTALPSPVKSSAASASTSLPPASSTASVSTSSDIVAGTGGAATPARSRFTEVAHVSDRIKDPGVL